MSNDSIRYAEESLGVHAIYSELIAIDERAEMEQAKLLELRRSLNRALADMGTSQPVGIATSTEVGETNDRIAECESAIAVLGMQHESRVARLTELGGYFIFLASLKTAQSNRSVPPGSPWVG